jgi:hypothetical protein
MKQHLTYQKPRLVEGTFWAGMKDFLVYVHKRQDIFARPLILMESVASVVNLLNLKGASSAI